MNLAERGQEDSGKGFSREGTLMLRRLDLQAGFGEVKNIPGKGAVKAKVLSGQAAGWSREWQRGKQ